MTKTETKPAKKDPIEVKILPGDPRPNPHEGKFPYESEVPNLPKKKIKFNYLQQPGSTLEFTKGRTVIKNTGRLGTVYEDYEIKDGEFVELTQDVIDHLNSLVYPEAGQMKPRFMCTAA